MQVMGTHVIRLFGHHLDIPAILMAAIELGGLFLLALALQDLLPHVGFSLTRYDAVLSAAFITGMTGAGMVAVGLYNREHVFQWDGAFSRALVLLPVLVVAMTASLAFEDLLMIGSYQGGYYILCFTVMTAFFPIFLLLRRLFVHLVYKTGAFTRRVLIVGSGPRAGKIEKLCRRSYDLSFTLVGYVHLISEPNCNRDYSMDERRGPQRRSDYWLPANDLLAFCSEKMVDEMVVALNERRGEMPVHDFLACKLAGITLTEYTAFWEREARQIDVESVNPSELVFSDGFRVGRLRSLVKRLFDIVVSLTLLLMTLPITILTMLLIRLESPGPAFYRQERIGQNGKAFSILKFRSMSNDAEKDGPRWAAKNDSRVTKVGAFIRKVRIDEIPQVINVLRGEMSFVGPRPERGVFVTALSEKIPYYMERHTVKPGITGWAQINYPYGASEEDARMKLAYDLYYVKNGSIFLDILIIVQTVKVLLWNSGAR